MIKGVYIVGFVCPSFVWQSFFYGKKEMIAHPQFSQIYKKKKKGKNSNCFESFLKAQN